MTFAFAILFFVVGVMTGAWVMFNGTGKAIERGWIEHRDKIYIVTPAEPVSRPSSSRQGTAP